MEDFRFQKDRHSLLYSFFSVLIKKLTFNKYKTIFSIYYIIGDKKKRDQLGMLKLFKLLQCSFEFLRGWGLYDYVLEKSAIQKHQWAHEKLTFSNPGSRKGAMQQSR